MSVVKDMREQIDTVVKENVKSKIFLTKIIQKIWDTKKRLKLRIIVIEEEEETQVKGIENIFNKFMEENFHNLKKRCLTIKEQEAYTPSKLNYKINLLCHIIIHNTKHTK